MAKELAYKIPLVFEPQPEGGYTVTCPILPELITEGDTIADVLANVEDALVAIIEAYEDLNRPLSCIPWGVRNCRDDMAPPIASGTIPPQTGSLRSRTGAAKTSRPARCGRSSGN
jgi:antitoxin HicB